LAASLALIGFTAAASVQLAMNGCWNIVSSRDANPLYEKSELTVRDYRPFNYIEPVGGMRVRVADQQGKIQRVIFFATDVSTLTSTQQSAVRSVVSDDLSYRVEGHTDEVGSRNYNRKLAERRAENVSQVLEKAGAKSVEVKAYGETQPVCRDHTSACHARNRRVVIRIKEAK